MMKKEIMDRLRKIILTALEGRIDAEFIIGDEDDLIMLLGINSIEAIEIIVRIENEFDIGIDDDDLGIDFLKSISKVADYIFNKM